MLQPVNLQLAHFNVEHSAQISRDAIAAAQQTGQEQEVVQESVKRAQRVEASWASAEAQKVKRKEENERERRREKQQQSFSESSNSFEETSEIETESKKGVPKSFDLYA
jgi:hypothetical protein